MLWPSELEIIDSLLTRCADINDLNNKKKNTDLNSQGALVVSNGYIIGEAAQGGDCFFDLVAQGMNQLSIPGGPFDVNSLRQACFDYARVNKDSVYDN